MKGYSLDLRTRVVRAIKQGMSKKKVAERYQISLATVKRYLRLERKRGNLAEKSPVRRRKTLIADKAELERLIKQKPGVTIEELCEAWQAKGKRRPSISTMWRAVNDLGLNKKKNPPKLRSVYRKKSGKKQKRWEGEA
jgi:transposase